jgi:aldehyde dehydrogenase (NAD+)
MPGGSKGETVALANDSAYGMAASIWTRDVYRTHRLVRDLEVGMVWANTYGCVANEVPFGCFKASGLGKEFGHEGLRAYCLEKSITMDCSAAELPLVARWYR